MTASLVALAAMYCSETACFAYRHMSLSVGLTCCQWLSPCLSRGLSLHLATRPGSSFLCLLALHPFKDETPTQLDSESNSA